MSRRAVRLEATKDGPRVVVQQVQQVEPPAPEPLADQEPPPEGPQTASKPELKTRLRPNRSSWRQRFSPPPPSKNKPPKREVKDEPTESDTPEEGDAKEEEEEASVPQPTAVEEFVLPDQVVQVDQIGDARVVEVEEEEVPVDEDGEETEDEVETGVQEQQVVLAEEELEEQMETETTEQTVEIVYDESAPESDRICAVVQHDALIQQFGLNLLNMSNQPNSRQTILAVSQRMIELVRLLRAAQGIDASVDSLAALFHVDNWPLIIDAIKYVSGYEDGTAKNPQYIMDIGQALRFCAFMLKREAQENDNQEYEQQAQQFYNSIESNMSTMLVQQPMEVEAPAPSTAIEAVAEVAAEEPNQYRVVLGTSGNDSQPVTLSLQVGENIAMPGTVQVVKIISTPSGKKGIIIPTRILSKKV